MTINESQTWILQCPLCLKRTEITIYQNSTPERVRCLHCEGEFLYSTKKKNLFSLAHWIFSDKDGFKRGSYRRVL